MSSYNRTRTVGIFLIERLQGLDRRLRCSLVLVVLTGVLPLCSLVLSPAPGGRVAGTGGRPKAIGALISIRSWTAPRVNPK